ncbi:NAD-dependent epimerase/dehydratase family protein [Plantactinospora sp. B6F1]|uniref:NAD-dependent epimerase/dehydratase family protein n=1 Tax=Plantactinospora sp. B6F1 TaxID=3158971 RepID=UPI0032D96914
MEIVGNGFLARSLAPVAGKHSDTVVLAAGVSWVNTTSRADFAREAALLRDAAHRCRATGRRLLYFSTASTGMYGTVDGPGTEDRPVVPCTPYGVHKLALEQQLRASGADYLVLRLGHLVGPGQPPHQLVPALIRQMRAGCVRIHRGAARDLIDARDAVRVIDRLLAMGLRGETVNVASGQATPVVEIADYLEQRLGLAARRLYLNVGMHHLISTEKLRALVPEVSTWFGAGYYRRVIDAYLAASAVIGAGNPNDD